MRDFRPCWNPGMETGSAYWIRPRWMSRETGCSCSFLLHFFYLFVCLSPCLSPAYLLFPPVALRSLSDVCFLVFVCYCLFVCLFNCDYLFMYSFACVCLFLCFFSCLFAQHLHQRTTFSRTLCGQRSRNCKSDHSAPSTHKYACAHTHTLFFHHQHYRIIPHSFQTWQKAPQDHWAAFSSPSTPPIQPKPPPPHLTPICSYHSHTWNYFSFLLMEVSRRRVLVPPSSQSLTQKSLTYYPDIYSEVQPLCCWWLLAETPADKCVSE